MIHSDIYKIVRSKNIADIISIINEDNDYYILIFSCYFKLLDVVLHIKKYHTITISKNIFLYYGCLDPISIDQLTIEDFFTFHPIPLSRCIDLIKKYNTNKVVVTAVLWLFAYYNYYDMDVYKLIDNEHLYVRNDMRFWAKLHNNDSIMSFIDNHYNKHHQYYGYTFMTSSELFILTGGSGYFPGLYSISSYTSDAINYMKIDWATHYYYMDDFIECIDDELLIEQQ